MRSLSCAGFLFCSVLPGFAEPLKAQGRAVPSEGTRRMAALLERINRESNPLGTPFFSSERLRLLSADIPLVKEPARRIALFSQLALEMLNSGKSEEAYRGFTQVEQLFEQYPRLVDSRKYAALSLFKAVCYLRLGEQENCLEHHTSESCILPIREAGIHKLQRGSRQAMELLEAHLNRYANDLKARWLLNIAAMTVGDYPENVPDKWRIDPKVFESDFAMPRFPDIAAEVGLDLDSLAGAVIAEDFNGDGYLDLLVSSWGVRDPLRYYHNQGDGSYVERTEEAGLAGLVGGLNMVHADYNNDGFPDVYILRGAWLQSEGRTPNSLLKSNGDGTFSDVTEEAGLLSFHPTQTAAWLDYNNDGWIDLYVGNESVGREIHPCELFRNNGDGTFTDVARAAGVDVVGFVKGVTAGDYDNDGRIDLYLSRLSQPNLLFRNDGAPGAGDPQGQEWKFKEVGAAAGVSEPLNSFPTWFWDYDNDGWLDLLVFGYYTGNVGDVAADYLGLPHRAETTRLYRNRGDGTFAEVSREARLDKVLLAMGSNFGDLDNDGWLDIYVGTGDPDLSTLIPNRAFRNAEGSFFQDVTTSGGFGHLQKGHGVAFADLDQDGDQDLYMSVGGAYTGDNYRNVLFENPGNENDWIVLKLEGRQSNRAALGARLKIRVQTAKGSRTIHRSVSTGGSFGALPLRREIGLGPGASLDSLEIVWPASGKRQTIGNLKVRSAYLIREGEEKAEPMEFKALPWARSPGGHAHHHHHKH